MKYHTKKIEYRCLTCSQVIKASDQKVNDVALKCFICANKFLENMRQRQNQKINIDDKKLKSKAAESKKKLIKLKNEKKIIWAAKDTKLKQKAKNRITAEIMKCESEISKLLEIK